MGSRMDKYYYEDLTGKKVNNDNNEVVTSRTKKNQELYKEVSNLELENFDLNSNVSVIGNSSKNIDIDQVRDMLDKKYRDNVPKKSSISDVSVQDMPRVKLDETREYDLSSVIKQAKNTKEIDYEEERFKKLGNTSYDILKNLDIYSHPKEEDEDLTLPIDDEIEVKSKSTIVDDKYGNHVDTMTEVFGEGFADTKNNELISLIDTITAKELVPKEQIEESTQDLDPLDILSDLRGDDENTKVIGANELEVIASKAINDPSFNNEESSTEELMRVVEDEIEDGIYDTNVDLSKTTINRTYKEVDETPTEEIIKLMEDEINDGIYDTNIELTKTTINRTYKEVDETPTEEIIKVMEKELNNIDNTSNIDITDSIELDTKEIKKQINIAEETPTEEIIDLMEGRLKDSNIEMTTINNMLDNNKKNDNFDDFADLRDDMKFSKVLIRILIFLLIIALIIGGLFIANKFLNLGLF